MTESSRYPQEINGTLREVTKESLKKGRVKGTKREMNHPQGHTPRPEGTGREGWPEPWVLHLSILATANRGHATGHSPGEWMPPPLAPGPRAPASTFHWPNQKPKNRQDPLTPATYVNVWGAQKAEKAREWIIFQITFHYWPLQDTEYRSLCYAVNPVAYLFHA